MGRSLVHQRHINACALIALQVRLANHAPVRISEDAKATLHSHELFRLVLVHAPSWNTTGCTTTCLLRSVSNRIFQKLTPSELITVIGWRNTLTEGNLHRGDSASCISIESLVCVEVSTFCVSRPPRSHSRECRPLISSWIGNMPCSTQGQPIKCFLP